MKSSRSFVVRALSFAGLVCVLSAGCTSAPKPIESVTVRDADFEIVKVLGEAEVREFESLLQQKDVVEAPFREGTGRRHYKLDVGRSGTSGRRWLYETTGHVTVLSAMRMPVYRLRDPGAFNRVIGAAR